jgi:hypothetical protein
VKGQTDIAQLIGHAFENFCCERPEKAGKYMLHGLDWNSGADTLAWKLFSSIRNPDF